MAGLAKCPARGGSPHANALSGGMGAVPPETEGSVLAQGNHRPRATGRRGSSERWPVRITPLGGLA